ncbi:hypothetical protein MACH16_04780 [Marinomonas pontica]|uniref:Uncharacterized protein n=1 Tax=Marinomonas pontica TaxID=264739 RepID=A0ABM8FCG8_9GAMM|nr:hypothetical protein MACH16_04780 [Marinomonas pontica]
MNDFIENITKIEQWAIEEINSNWTIEFSVELKDDELLERVVRDFMATHPLGVFLAAPNYGRLLVIQILDFYDLLSVENIYFVESELKRDLDDYTCYASFIDCTLRQLKLKRSI